MFDRLAAIDLIADTIKAYVQSLLKVQLSNDLLFHMKLWPQDGTWEKLGSHETVMFDLCADST